MTFITSNTKKNIYKVKQCRKVIHKSTQHVSYIKFKYRSSTTFNEHKRVYGIKI